MTNIEQSMAHHFERHISSSISNTLKGKWANDANWHVYYKPMGDVYSLFAIISLTPITDTIYNYRIKKQVEYNFNGDNYNVSFAVHKTTGHQAVTITQREDQ